MTAKEQYRALCETEGTRIPLFLQYWWMQAVCEGKNWDVILIQQPNTQNIQAALPYLTGSRMGMRYILQPQLTQHSGPVYLIPDHLEYHQRIELEHKLAMQLIDRLEELHLAYYEQNWSPLVTDWLPFHWRGYSQTTRYTYRINDISNPDQVFAHFDRQKRQKKILKAQEVLCPTLAITPKEFARFHAAYWERRGERDLLSEAFIIRVCEAAISCNQGIIMGLEDQQGELQAARFVVWDEECAYSLLSALGTNHDNGASALLFWYLIQALHDKTRAFDFEGSMDPGIEYSYRLYGATQTSYHNVSRCNNGMFNLLLWAKRQQKNR